MLISGAFLGVFIGEAVGVGFTDAIFSATVFSAFGGFLGVLLTARTAVLQVKRQQLLRERSASDLNSFIDPLDSIHEAFGNLMLSNRSEEDLELYFSAIAKAGAEITSGAGNRMCIYTFDSSERLEQDEVIEGLSIRISRGRPDKARPRFTSETLYGRQFVDTARGQQAYCVDDARKRTATNDRRPNSAWKSYMVVPVVYRNTNYGAISIDSEDIKRHTQTDRKIGHMLASLVGIGERIAESGGKEVKPEMKIAMRKLKKIRSEEEANAWDE